MERVICQVNGMSCSSCTMTVSGYLEKKGMTDVLVSLATGEVSFRAPPDADLPLVLAGIDRLGYQVVLPQKTGTPARMKILSAGTLFWFCLLFTLPQVAAMWLPWKFLHLIIVQGALATPVYLAGIWHFGKSALGALRIRIANMDLLVTVGASAAYLYSVAGLIFQLGDQYMFFETSSSILTLVLLGNLLEQKTVKHTATAITELAGLQLTRATRILQDGTTQDIDNTELKTGDEVQVNTGDKIPADGEILWGSGSANESMITGESIPVTKKISDRVIGGTLLEEGSLRVRITATGTDTILSYIIELVRQAGNNKTPMQKLADRISAIFVPAVLGIALLVLLASCYLFHLSFAASILRSIAVLVIACPCAMGLATPAAVMVGLGRAARNGILIQGADTLELFSHIRTVVFDKTGTLTTGKLKIAAFNSSTLPPQTFMDLVASLETHSSHPIARSVLEAWKPDPSSIWSAVKETKGLGIGAMDGQGREYLLGSYRFTQASGPEQGHDIYLVIDGRPSGWVDIADDLRPGAREVIRRIQSRGIRTVLLSGDRKEKCAHLAREAGITEVFAEQSAAGKLEKLKELLGSGPVAMVGDGINDAPALAAASIGISLSDSTQAARQTARVVLMNNNLDHLPLALALGKNTYLTIKQNLFWAFFYNIIAIPVAAAGLLNPVIAAAAMGLSDLFLVANSIRLKYKKLA